MTWDQPDANPLLDVATYKAMMERASRASYQPNRLIVSPALMEWPTVLVWHGYETLDRTRPWPRIDLFPAVTRHKQRYLMRLEKLALRIAFDHTPHDTRRERFFYRLSRWFRDIAWPR